MSLGSVFSPRLPLLLLLVASCCLEDVHSFPGGRSSRSAWPDEYGGVNVAATVDLRGTSLSIDPSSVAVGEEETPVKTLLIRRRRQDNSPPSPPDPPVPDPPSPSTGGGGAEPNIARLDTDTLRIPGGPFRFINPSTFFNPFSSFNPFAGPPPRRFGGGPFYGRRSYYRRDPISSFFDGVESFKRDLVNFFFG